MAALFLDNQDIIPHQHVLVVHGRAQNSEVVLLVDKREIWLHLLVDTRCAIIIFLTIVGFRFTTKIICKMRFHLL